jgi:hypothetical protein
MIVTSIETLLVDNPEWQARSKQLQTATTLTELVWITLQMGLLMSRLLLETLLNERGEAASDWPDCPACGKRLRSKGYRVRQLTTLVGAIH